MAQQLQRHQAFLRLGKIKKGPESALIAARHNLRELPLTPNIAQGKQYLNEVLQGPSEAAAVQANYEAVLVKQGVPKLRKDAVRLIEALVSLPVGINDPKHQYFHAALQWLAAEFGKANILSAVIHKDEAAQHMHVLIIPLIEGRMRGADLMGGPAIMRDRHARFVASMQQPWVQLGISVQQSTRLRKAAMAEEVLTYLKRTNDPLWKSDVAQVIRDCIESNPEPFYLTLGCSHKGVARSSTRVRHPRRRKQPTMAEIFTRPIKGMRGSKAERYRQSAEYLRAHAVAPKRKAADSYTQPQEAKQAHPAPTSNKLCIDGANRWREQPMTLLPMRTLCSVGFAVMEPVACGPIQRIEDAKHTALQKRPTALGAGNGSSTPQCKRGQRLACSESKCRSFAVPLHGKLLHWWLLKSRLP